MWMRLWWRSIIRTLRLLVADWECGRNSSPRATSRGQRASHLWGASIRRLCKTRRVSAQGHSIRFPLELSPVARATLKPYKPQPQRAGTYSPTRKQIFLLSLRDRKAVAGEILLTIGGEADQAPSALSKFFCRAIVPVMTIKRVPTYSAYRPAPGSTAPTGLEEEIRYPEAR